MSRQPHLVENHRHVPLSATSWGRLFRTLAVAPLVVCVFAAFLFCLPFTLIDLVRKHL